MFNSNNLERIVTAALALLLILGMLIITIGESSKGLSVNLPEWLQTSAGLALGYYFGVHRMSNNKNGGE